jgi:hypothetical protein
VFEMLTVIRNHKIAALILGIILLCLAISAFVIFSTHSAKVPARGVFVINSNNAIAKIVKAY